MMNIDITDMKSRELVNIFKMYPSGALAIKYERIFWCSDYSEPADSRDYPSYPFDPRGRVPNPGLPKAAAAFGAAADRLGSMVAPPQRR